MDNTYKRSKYIAFDCETTGVNDKCNLLTVSFIILDKDLNEIDKLNISLKQNEGYIVYPEAMEVNKINIIRHHKESIPLFEAKRKVLSFLTQNKGQYSLIPIGHNINFDIKFIKNSGILTELEYSTFMSYNNIDTVSIAQFLKLSGILHERQSLSLVNLCNSVNLNRNEQLEHSAEYDTKMTIKLLKRFKNMISPQTLNNSTKKRKISSN